MLFRSKREGTFMVQGGYPSALEDHERLPCRKMIFSHSSTMVDGFGMWNVKGMSHGALFLRPTTLTHGRVLLSMEYLYFLTICKQCIAPYESKIIHGFQGHFRETSCDVDDPYLHEFGQVSY